MEKVEKYILERIQEDDNLLRRYSNKSILKATSPKGLKGHMRLRGDGGGESIPYFQF